MFSEIGLCIYARKFCGPLIKTNDQTQNNQITCLGQVYVQINMPVLVKIGYENSELNKKEQICKKSLTFFLLLNWLYNPFLDKYDSETNEIP